MSTSATLVVGSDGSSTKLGRSSGITSQADREAFLKRRRLADVIIIGGNTARSEPYKKTPVPLVIISRSPENPVECNPLAHLWNSTPGDAILRAGKLFGPNILIEGGVRMISELLGEQLIDEFFLSVTSASSGENLIDWKKILDEFSFIQESEIDGTRFFNAHN